MCVVGLRIVQDLLGSFITTELLAELE